MHDIIEFTKKMQKIRSFTLEIQTYFLPVTQRKDSELFQYPRIPSYISPSKTYKTFEVDINTPYPIVLVNKSPFPVTIILNYDYFTPAEIFKHFKIPPINSYQIIGEILHLNLDQNHQEYKYIIGAIFLEKILRIKTVLSKTSNISNKFRNIDFEILAGDDDLSTIHIENGIKYFINYKYIYWNGKLQKERLSLTESFKSGDTICDVFCGCGPLVMLALKHSCRVYCNDLNEVAINCLNKSLNINKLVCDTVFNLDAVDFLEYIIKNEIHVDHFVMNLPEKSMEYVKYLEKYVFSFMLHCYFFAQRKEDVLKKVKNFVYFKVSREDIVFVRSVSPSKDMYKLTVKVTK